MKAMIFAAGLGTRLRPLTNDKPKALVEYKGKPLLWHVLNKVTAAGFDFIVVNVHHFAQQIIDYLNHNQFNAQIHISYEDELLETGGGLYKARHLLNSGEPFLVHNVDIISEIDLEKLYKAHQKETLATLAVRDNPRSRALLFTPQNIMCGWTNLVTGEKRIARDCQNNAMPKAFSGIHVLSPKIFDFMHHGKYSIIETYLKAAKTETIKGFDHSGQLWKDMGKPESFYD